MIVSSTLRKRAYLEYADCPNVVDMLPKPYTADLLITTIANALDTGSLVVDSQRQGTAVPEVMHEARAKSALSGDFENFSLREVLDFLNNGEKARHAGSGDWSETACSSICSRGACRR